MAIEQQEVGRRDSRARTSAKAGAGGTTPPRIEPEPEGRPAEGEREADEPTEPRAAAHHGATSSGAFGISPNISGA